MAKLLEDVCDICTEALLSGIVVICFLVFVFAIFLGGASRSNHAYCAILPMLDSPWANFVRFASKAITFGQNAALISAGVAAFGAAVIILPGLLAGGLGGAAVAFNNAAAAMGTTLVGNISIRSGCWWLLQKGALMLGKKGAVATVAIVAAPIANTALCQVFGSVLAFLGIVIILCVPRYLYTSSLFQNSQGSNHHSTFFRVFAFVGLISGTITTLGAGLVGANRQAWIVGWLIFTLAHAGLALKAPALVADVSQTTDNNPVKLVERYYRNRGRLSLLWWIFLSLLLPTAVATIPFLVEDRDGTLLSLSRSFSKLSYPLFI